MIIDAGVVFAGFLPVFCEVGAKISLRAKIAGGISGFFVKMRQRNNIYKITGAADVKARILRPGILDNAYRL